jgi:hypothetical protein
MIVGDLVIRPHAKFTDRHCIGMGVEAILTGDALDPDAWEHQSL